MVDEVATVISMKSVMRAIHKVPPTLRVSSCTMACPFLNNVWDEIIYSVSSNLFFSGAVEHVNQSCAVISSA